jgi:hypothetical protein
MRISTKITAALIACTSPFVACGSAQAGPCSAEIAQFEAAIRQSRGNPDAGLMAHQSVDAQLSHQPTPSSPRRVENRLQSKFSARMARAKLLDAQGDPGCTTALGAAKKLYIP